MEDKLMQCPHCGSNVCYVQKVGAEETAMCMACGYTTTTMMKEGSQSELQVSRRQPILYRELKFVDSNGSVWYPAVITLPGVGMVYLDGTSKDNYEWVMTPFRKVTRRERRLRKLSKEQEYVADAANTQRFGKDGFVEAAAALGVFGQE